MRVFYRGVFPLKDGFPGSQLASFVIKFLLRALELHVFFPCFMGRLVGRSFFSACLRIFDELVDNVGLKTDVVMLADLASRGRGFSCLVVIGLEMRVCLFNHYVERVFF